MPARTSALRALLIPVCVLVLMPAAVRPARAADPTAPPKAFVAVPGPDAEYLALTDRYTLRADGAVVHERRSRLQVNSYLAINRKWGESKVPYDPAIETFEVLGNRTVPPTGAAVEAPANALVDDQPPGAEHDPLWSGLRRKVIAHTALEPGAVIEESWRVTRAAAAAPWLELSEPLAFEPPVRSRVVEVDLPAGTPMRWQAVGRPQTEPKRESAAGRDVWRWSLDNVPASPPEPGAPAELPTLVVTTCPGRDALAAELRRRAGDAAGAPESLLALARKADAATPGDEARVLAVLDAVAQAVALAPIAPSQQDWRPRSLDDVWRAGVATRLELAGLQAAALRAVGFASATAAVAGSEGRSLDRCPALAGLDTALVMVRWAGEGARSYDPARPLEGGPVEATTRPESVLAVSAFDGAPGTLAWPAVGAREARLVLAVAPDGVVKGTLEFSASGGLTPHAALVRDPAKPARELAGAIPDVKATNVRVTALRRSDASLVADVEGKLPARNALGLVRWTLPELPGGIESTLPPPPAAGRQSPVALPPPCREAIETTVTLPAGWSVAAFPAAAPVRNDTGSVTVAGALLPDGRVRLTRTLELHRALVPAVEADQVRALLTALLAPAGRELILRPPAEAGKK